MFASGILNVLLGLYVLGLWIYLLGRTGLKICWFFIIAGVVGAALAVIDALLYYDRSAGMHFLGTPGWTTFFYAFVFVRFATYIIGVIGTTFLVVWIRKAHEALSHSKA